MNADACGDALMRVNINGSHMEHISSGIIATNLKLPGHES